MRREMLSAGLRKTVGDIQGAANGQMPCGMVSDITRTGYD